MRKLFLDTNVIIDLLFDRKPFSDEAASLVQLKEAGVVELYLSSLSLANMAYIAQRSHKDPSIMVDAILHYIEVIDLDKETFVAVNNSRFSDYEDGLQYFSALKIKDVEAIITRDKRHFKAARIQVMTPSEFLSLPGIKSLL